MKPCMGLIGVQIRILLVTFSARRDIPFLNLPTGSHFDKCDPMSQTLQPTLWRTCRALASHQRLRLMQVLYKNGEMTVSQVAREVRRPLSAVSENLRALNARGLLKVRRRGRYVSYRIGADASVPGAAELLRAVTTVLNSRRDGRSFSFKALTGLTHYRRHTILYVLHQRAHSFADLIHDARIPAPALKRHLRKLRDRDLIEFKNGAYRLAKSRDPLRNALLKLASRPP